VEKSKSGLSPLAWKSRKLGGIPTLPQPPRLLVKIHYRTLQLLPLPDISCANDKRGNQS
jgi:hypothetical protein